MTQTQLIEHIRKSGKLLADDEQIKIAADILFPLTPSDERALAGETTTSRQRWLKIATADVDRAGDELVIEGVVTANFERNPQFLWQHGMTEEPIHTIGRIVRLVQTKNALYALAEYASADISPLAGKIFDLDMAGLLPANSVGFQPIEWEPNAHGGVRFTKWELIEVSKVELPCNPFAIDDGLPGKRLSLSDAAGLL
ncbi:MAG: hypothetical protein JSS75_09370 [Bacteroidetes bacterium]|nr:hypothetical protein [Bacteroidota bacterium]